ncbi:MAG TPA: hypothetical protein VEI54_04315 [Candidatus Limnocylindrales bacterium]|nr:hypothetical protein [Candidatus Limnocylindrales bacterium]
MKQPSGMEQKKKPYQSPKLLIYGDLNQMTQSHGTHAKPDGAMTGTNRRTGA